MQVQEFFESLTTWITLVLQLLIIVVAVLSTIGGAVFVGYLMFSGGS